MSSKITLDQETFKALAADTRIDILKRLSEHKLTLTDLSTATKMSPSTIKEHLDRLVAAGLIEQMESETKWKYYRLTPKGEGILSPYETKVWILLATSVFTLVGAGMGLASRMGKTISTSASSLLPKLPLRSAISKSAKDGIMEAAPGVDTISNAQGLQAEAIAKTVEAVSTSVTTTLSPVTTTLADAIQKNAGWMFDDGDHDIVKEVALKKSGTLVDSMPDAEMRLYQASSDQIGRMYKTAENSIPPTLDAINSTIDAFEGEVSNALDKVADSIPIIEVADTVTTTLVSPVTATLTQAIAQTSAPQIFYDPWMWAFGSLLVISFFGIVLGISRIYAIRRQGEEPPVSDD